MAENLPKFRREFKRYKQRKPPPDFSDVIDFEQEETWRGRVKKCCCTVLAEADNKFDTTQLGLNDLETWKCYEIEAYEGFKVIVNPFTTTGQRQWIEKCVRSYPGKPNVCNLDAHVERKDQNLWKLYEEQCLNKCTQPNSKLSKVLMDQLRWVTLGYHYNWDTKKYYKENFTEFPCDIGELSKFIARTMGYPCFIPEAAIINYYHMDSTLSGHTDHSEFDLTAPLFSISFGQTCIFLLGGQTLDDSPCAMYLRSGDIVVMSRDTRLAYHAVPRIIRHEELAGLLTQDTEMSSEHSLHCLEKYLSYSRINVNIRQVEGPSGRFASEVNSVSNTI